MHQERKEQHQVLKAESKSTVNNLKYRFSIGNTSRLSPNLQKALGKYGNELIVKVELNKQPILLPVHNILSRLTRDRIDRKARELGEDNIFHTALVITLQGGTRILLEKNATLMVEKLKNEEYTNNSAQLEVRPGLTLNELIENASKTPQAAKTLFEYDARSDPHYGYNCQATTRQLIRSSRTYFKINEQTRSALHEQDAKALLGTLPQALQSLPDLITNLGARWNRLWGR